MAIHLFENAKHSVFADSLKVMTLDYVESVAKCRYVLVIVAWLLHDYYVDSSKLSLLTNDESIVVHRLLTAVQHTCLAIDKETTKNALVVGDFLVKCIVRKYGMSTLTALCEKETDFTWLIPKHLQKDSSESQVSQMTLYVNYLCVD